MSSPVKGALIRLTITTLAALLLLTILPTPARSASRDALLMREHRQVTSLHAYLGTVRFFQHHGRLAQTRPGRRALRIAHIWIPIIRRELAETRAQLRPRPLFAAWWLAEATCIHQHEGAWNSNTGNGYFGGMQFLPSTYRSVGGRADGRADLDSPQEQLRRAWLVWRRDGGSWSEWGTRGLCGV